MIVKKQWLVIIIFSQENINVEEFDWYLDDNNRIAGYDIQADYGEVSKLNNLLEKLK